MSTVCRRRFVAGATATGGVLALAACAGPAPPEMRRFYLSTPASPAGLPGASWSLQIDPPQAVPALNTPRIAQVIASNEFDYYADAEWGDPAPVMVQAVLVNAFEATGALPLVVTERARTRPDFVLQTDLARFYGEGAVGSAATARVGLRVELMRFSGREVVAAKSFEHTAQATAPGVEALVAAFDTAAQSVFGELIVWALAEGTAAGHGS